MFLWKSQTNDFSNGRKIWQDDISREKTLFEIFLYGENLSEAQERFCNTISDFQVTIIIDKLHPESVNSALSRNIRPVCWSRIIWKIHRELTGEDFWVMLMNRIWIQYLSPREMNDLWQNLHLENGYITFEEVGFVTKRRGLSSSAILTQASRFTSLCW